MDMLKKLSSGIACLIMMCSASPIWAENSLKVGIDQHKSEIFIDEQGHYRGLFIDVLQHIAEAESWQLEYVICQRNQCLEALERGDLDLLPNVASSEEIARRFDFNREAVLSSGSVVYRNIHSSIHTIQDLDRKHIAVVEDSIQYTWLKSRVREIGVAPYFLEVKDLAAVMAMIEQGKADGGIVNRRFGLQHATTPVVVKTDIIVNPSRLYFIVPKNRNGHLIAALDRHLATLKQNPNSIYYLSLERWSEPPLTKRQELAWKNWSVVSLGAIIIFLIGLLLIFRAMVKRRTRELEKSKERFRGLVETTSDWVWEIDESAVFTYTSPGVERLLGYTRAEILGRRIFDFMPVEEEVSRLTAEYQDIFNARKPIEGLETTVRHKGGCAVILERNGVPIIGAGGELLGYRGIDRDISERRRAEQSLRESEQQFRSILDNMVDTYYRTDVKGRLVLLSPSVRSLVGWNPSEVIGTEVADYYVNPDDRYAFLETLEANGGTVVGYETLLRHKNGSGVWVATTAHFYRNDAGDVLGVEGTVRDISDFKRAQAEMQLAASVFDGSAEGIIITNPEGRILRVNQAFVDITGYSSEEVVGKKPWFLLSDQHYDKPKEVWESLSENVIWRGDIWHRRKDREIYPVWQNISAIQDEQGNIKHYISIFCDITEKKVSEERIQYLAHYDALTDLPNRLMFTERCEHALTRAEREKHQVAVLFLDLDHFKNINDSLGHPIGDKVLQTVATRLMQQVRKEDTVARLGGDEFTIVMEEIHEPRDASLVARKVLKALKQPLEVDGHELQIGASVGISLYPDDGRDVTTLIKNADAAMYRAKEQGRDNYQFYTSELTEHAFERVYFENELRQALERDEIILYYQPQYGVEGEALVGAEVLVRWMHPEKGLLLPEEFIKN